MAKLDRLLKKARAQNKKGRSSKALDLFREACEEAPHDPDVWLERAGVAEELNGKDEAVEALFHAADLYARAGLSGEAAEISERVLEMNPKHGGARRFVRMMRGRGRAPTADPGAGKKAAKGKAAKEKPPKDKPAKEKPVEEKPAKEKPAKEEAAEEKAAASEPAQEKAGKAKPAKKVAKGKHAKKKGGRAKAARKKAEEQKTVAEKPSKEEQAEEKPAATEPAAKEEPKGKKASREKPAKEEPEPKQAAAAQPAAEEPVKQEAPPPAEEKPAAKEKPAEDKPQTAAEAREKPASAAGGAEEDDDDLEIDVHEEDYAAVSIEERKPEVVWTPALTAGMEPDAAPEEPSAVDAALRAKARAEARAKSEAEPVRPVEHRMGRVTGEIALGDLSLAAMLDEAEADAATEFPLDDEDDLRLVQAVAATVTSSPLLSELDSDLVKYLIDCGRVTRTLKGKAVFMEGESGTSLYLILEGSVTVERNDPDTGRVRRLATLRRGAFFGEMALITDAPRSATVRGKRDSTLLEVSREAVLGLVKRDNRVLKLLMRFFRARLVGNLLATSPLFQDFDVDARRQIVRQFRLRELPGGFRVLEKGERSDGLYLVLAGDLVAFLPELEGGEQLLGELGPGDVFGEMSLLEGTTATASIRALVRSWVLRLPRDEFAKLIAEHPLLLEQLAEIAETRRKANVETLSSAQVRPV